MMDFLDPKKARAKFIRLIIGYVLIAIALVLATTVLLYLANGFGVQQGKVIQNGLVFVSSNPSGAAIYLNDKQQDNQTNSRLVLPSGTYTMRLARDGYREWQRAVTVEGGSVDHFDYPLLIPSKLSSSLVSEYPAQPLLATQSPDRRWLLVQPSSQALNFDVYDLRDPKEVKTRKTTITMPANILGLPQSENQTFKLAEWARNNTHVVLQHIVGDQMEYILLSRDKPEESVNLTRKLNLAAGDEISLQDKKFDRYFIHSASAQTLTTATLDNPTPVPLLNGVIAYKTYGADVVLYATGVGAPEGKVVVKQYQDGKSYIIRQIPKQNDYLLDISTYDSHWYSVVGSAAEDHVYVYKDAVDRLKNDANQAMAPVESMKLKTPNYIEFSANSQFIMTENGQDIATFDAENERSYNYRLDRPVDDPQQHVTWMDGYHLRFVSRGELTILDYDGSNVQTLVGGNPAYLPFFDTAYETAYSMTTLTTGEQAGKLTSLSATPLRTVQDR
jgi:hypothetical protein